MENKQLKMSFLKLLASLTFGVFIALKFNLFLCFAVLMETADRLAWYRYVRDLIIAATHVLNLRC